MMRGSKSVLAAAVAVALVGLWSAAANAGIMTSGSRGAFDAAYPDAGVETWDSYIAGTTIANGSVVNGVTYSSSSGVSVVTSTFLTTSGPNGLGRTPIEFFDPSDTITFSFGTAIKAFGIDVNTFDTAIGGYTATTNVGDVASSVFDPFPGYGTGQFVGFKSDAAFTSVSIAAPGGYSYTLDTMRFREVPEPAAATILGFGLAGLYLVGRRRRT